MVALSKKRLEQQENSKIAVERTRLLITGMKVFLLFMTATIIIINLEIYENLQKEATSAQSAVITDAVANNNNSNTNNAAIMATTDENNNDNNEASNNNNIMHVVFSTSCSLSHDWQSYLFFFHAMIHHQQGDVTRIVSGCSPDDEVKMQELHDKHFTVMNPKFLLHFTPEFGKQLQSEGVSFQQTKYWNKPFGLKHWLEHRFGYTWNKDGTEADEYGSKVTVPAYDDHIVVLVDPDMLMQKPFVNNFSDTPLNQWNKYYRGGKHNDLLKGKVIQGHPAAQDYSFGPKWIEPVREYLEEIVGTESPVHAVTSDEARYVYAAGPPYWMTVRDAYRISYKWSEFLPRIFKRHPVFMAEMYGYCMAAAHLGLKHQMARGMMVSNVERRMTEGEGWSFLPKDDRACEVSRYAKTVPNVIHFCQRYTIGEYFINKYLFPTDILTCDFPLMELPPRDILQTTWYSHFGDGSVKEWDKSKDDIERYRNAFMICSLFPAINAAATFYKDQHCSSKDPTGDTTTTTKTNYELSYNHFRSDRGKELVAQGIKKRAKEAASK